MSFSALAFSSRPFLVSLVLVCLCHLSVSSLYANHVHVHVAWRSDALVLEVFDFDTGTLEADAFPFVLGSPSITVVPESSAYRFLGEAGASFFVLPQDDDPRLPYLGLSVDSVSSSTFTGNELQLRLIGVTGPGHFALYRVNVFGQPVIWMNTRDGIDPELDSHTLLTGGHEHQNWAFSAPGEYELTFVAEAIRRSTGQKISSSATSYRFRVLSPSKAHLAIEIDPAVGLPLLRIQSRKGARIQLLESETFGEWRIHSTRLLRMPEWTIAPQAVGESLRFWRVQEVFD